MINSIKETYKDFSTFLKRPADKPDPIQTRQQKVKRLFSLLAIDIPIMGVLMAIVYAIEKFGLINTDKHKMVMLLQQLPIWWIILFGVVIMPIIEELVFRLYLRFKHNYLARLIILLAFLTGKQNKIIVETQLKNFWVNKFRAIFYFSAIIFSIVHLANFEYSINILLFSPILIAPQFIMGLFLGYLRVRYNLILGILLHALHNAIFLIIPIIFMSGAVEKLNVKTNSYSLKIEEHTLKQMNVSSTFGTDTINFNGTSLKSIIAYLLEKDEKLIDFSSNQMADKRISLSFKKYSKDSSNDKKTILKHLSQVYNFKLESNKVFQLIWEIDLQDSAKLLKHKSNTLGNSSITSMSLKEIKIENADLAQLAKDLTSNYNRFITNKADIKGKFDFAIPKKDSNELENLLRSQYGLSLKRNDKELEYTYINFLEAE
jgi:membrane protease YdiL (CAAX protease family)